MLKFNLYSRLLSDQGGEKQDQDIQNHFAKSLLNFSTLLLQSSIDDLGLRQTISSFVGYISQSMLGGVDRHSLNTAILGPFLTVLSILRSKKPEIIKIRDEDIWSLTTQGLNQHLSVPGKVAILGGTNWSERFIKPRSRITF